MSFPPIYIIKMSGSDRNPELYKNLEKLGLSYQIQDAVIGKNLTDSDISLKVNLRSCYARLGYPISRNLIGCALSHREVYKKASMENFEWILVLEEDSILSNFDISLVSEITSKELNEPEIIQLFSRSARMINSSTLLKIGNGTREIFDFVPRLAGCGASAYLINKAALKISLENQLLGGPPDWPEWSHKVKIKGVYPWMTTESDLGSTIPLVTIPKFKYIGRRVMQLTFIHFLIYRREYLNFNSYLREEIIPFFLYCNWKLSGSKFYKDDPNGPQVNNCLFYS